MIEHEIPLREVNAAASREKKHPRRHVELIHQWPARRPRSAVRVAIAAALLRVPKTEKEIADRLKLLADLAPYKCSPRALERVRKLILEENSGRPPKVLDLFAGGGAIPLEAANLGCEAHAVELNPVAHIIELATCVYPQRYGARLADLVEKWGKWVLDRVRGEIADLYPPVRIADKLGAMQLAFAHVGSGGDGTVEVHPIAYLWTRTVPCVNHHECGATVPLARQTWLCRKADRSIALKIVPDRKEMRARFEIISAAKPSNLGFDPTDLSDRGDADCPFCGATVDADKVKEYGKRGKLGTQLMAVAGTIDGERGRVYVPAEAVELPSDARLRKRLAAFGDEWPGPAALRMPDKDTLNFKLPLYGVNTFAEMFTDRQAIALLTFSRTIREAHQAILRSEHDEGIAKATATYLALALDKLADNDCCFARWESSDQIVKNALSQQALKMIWDFAELTPYADISGSFLLTLKTEVEAVRGLCAVPEPSSCIRSSATELPYPAAEFDAIITDPPYYDNISYSDLSDFFYVWLKRSLGACFDIPQKISTPAGDRDQKER